MEQAKFKALLDRYILGQSTPEESEQVSRLLDSYENQQEAPVLSADEKEQLRQQMLSKLLNTVQHRPKRSFLYTYKWAAAAVILLVMGLLITFQFTRSKTPAMIVAVKRSSAPEPVGSNRAYLKLGDGKIVVLDSTGKGLVALQGGTRITKSDDVSLQYSAAKEHSSNQVTYNTISTPGGSTYRLTLPDGTRVWLNAVSSLTFPTQFNGSSRTVKLSGEAYFEVAKQMIKTNGRTTRKPFIVTAGESEVEVLGTHFNITAYKENGQQETTLLEGAVNVRHAGQLKSILPGEQAVVKSGGGPPIIRMANLETVMAWKDGLFSFDNADIPSVMNEIARWYNAKIIYKGDIPSASFTGILPRDTDMRSMLEWLESTHAVKFQLDGDVITVEKIN